MLTEKNTSDKYKYCEFCGRTLPKHYEGTLCPTCQEAQLFRNVRDYIRANTVNEYEVAEHFHIPLRQIKEWIREGRIEYHGSTQLPLSPACTASAVVLRFLSVPCVRIV